MPGIVNDPIRGLVDGPVGDPMIARIAATCATELAPEDPGALNELGRALILDGDFVDARRMFERSLAVEPDQPDTLFALARLSAADAARRGHFTGQELERHRALTTAALELDPQHVHARYHLVRVAIRSADWRTAVRAAGLGDGPDVTDRLLSVDVAPDDADALLCTLRDTAPPLDVLVVAFWRLQHVAAYRAAFEVKDLLAQRLLATTCTTGLNDLITTVRALTTLGRFEDAVRIIHRERRRHRGPRSLSLLRKLEADVTFLDGDVSQHQLMPVVVNSPAERRFDHLVRGRSVAIVGPLDTGHALDLGEFDVVIRTKYLGKGTAPRQPVIAYFANAGAQLLGDEIGDALARGEIDLAVLRPSIIDVDPRALSRRTNVRVAPAENAALLEASPYGIPRAIYDVLRYRPRRVMLFNADFFAGGRRYDDGYQRDKARGLTEAIVGYGHDLRADHRAIKRLLETGVIGASPDVRAILDLSTEEYLSCLTSSHAARFDAT